MPNIHIKSVAVAAILIAGLYASLAARAEQGYRGDGASASADAIISVTIIQPVEIMKNQDLSFGQIYADTVPHDVVLGADDSRTVAGQADILGDSAGVQAAGFTIRGEQHATYNITISSPGTLTNEQGDMMTFDTLISDPAGTGMLGSIDDGTAGSQELKVGATLHIGADQPSGDYSGTFNVQVNYN